jgi:hypothetical protein
LYCRQNLESKHFNREHVLPEAFGSFEDNLVLIDTVCETCNAYFGNHLELKLARDSIEGLERYEHGIKLPNDKTSYGRGRLLTARVNDGGFYHGAEVWWGPSQDGTRLVLLPFPQIGVSYESGHQQWFRIDEIPTKPELHRLGFAPGTALTIKIFGADPKDVEQRLAEKGYALSPLEIRDGAPESQEAEITITGKIDRTLMRAVAKIAYNYLAYYYRGIALMEQFDQIRRYVRYDETPSGAPVTLTSSDFLAGLPADRAPVVHGIGVSWRDGQAVGQVTLFFRFHYRVVLADGGFVVPPTVINQGHLFDPINHQIVELTSDPRRGRPIRVPVPEK